MLSVAWCGVNAHQLVGGDATGELRLWDIRRAGTVHTFDQHDADDPGSDGGSDGESDHGAGAGEGRYGAGPHHGVDRDLLKCFSHRAHRSLV